MSSRRHFLRSLPLLAPLVSCRQSAGAPLPPRPAGYRIIHALVCLCDNEHQNIAKVPEKIGRGRDLGNNLYWGNAEGLAGVFGKAKQWALLGKPAPPAGQEIILERRAYHHAKHKALLVADAYRGESMRECLATYFGYLAGNEAVAVAAGERTFPAGGTSDFIAFIGHNGLMDFTLDVPARESAATPKATAAFCCRSLAYFNPLLTELGTKPYCLTKQNMYPGAFLLRDVLEAWLSGETPQGATARAAAAYAANQKISLKAASGVFGLP
jgi:hypothetical protein